MKINNIQVCELNNVCLHGVSTRCAVYVEYHPASNKDGAIGLGGCAPGVQACVIAEPVKDGSKFYDGLLVLPLNAPAGPAISTLVCKRLALVQKMHKPTIDQLRVNYFFYAWGRSAHTQPPFSLQAVTAVNSTMWSPPSAYLGYLLRSSSARHAKFAFYWWLFDQWKFWEMARVQYFDRHAQAQANHSTCPASFDTFRKTCQYLRLSCNVKTSRQLARQRTHAVGRLRYTKDIIDGFWNP